MCERFRVSKPLNWSAITTKSHRNNWTFFKIRYIYTKGGILTFKIVYSTGLGSSQKNTETENQHEETRQNRSSTLGSLQAVVINACDMLLTYTALFKDGARKHKRRIERRIFYEQDLFGPNMTFCVCADTCDCTRQTKRPECNKTNTFKTKVWKRKQKYIRVSIQF